MDIKLKTGDIVKIENAYFKSDNGLYFVTHCPGDVNWLGNDYCLKKICKSGKLSKAKYSTCFWPLCSYVNDREKAAEADAWNKENAIIAKIYNVNTEFIIEYFKNKVEEFKEKYKNNAMYYGEKYKYTIIAKNTLEHYQNIVKRMACGDIQEDKKKVAEEKPEGSKEKEIQGEEEPQAVKRTYYPIDEDTARIAKEVNSFAGYKKGDATAEYRNYCNMAYDILDKIKTEKPKQAKYAAKKVDYYCRKLAEYYNDYYRNEASCPSVLISGAGNFPTRKKERQNSHRETLYKTWEYLENYLCKIEDILYNEQPVKLSDSDAIEKLTTKIQQLEKEHKMHMACNAYCKKNGTLKGFSGLEELEEKEVSYIESSLEKSPAFMPFITYNETANIRRYKKQLERLVNEKETGTTEQIEVDSENNNLFTVVENKEIMRLQILFDDIPPVNARDILKSNGFRWSPKNKAWQRQLTDNARYAYKNIKDELKSAIVA